MIEALIIVDIQYDFMPDGALGVKKADEVVPIINSIIGKFYLVIASQDWHPENHVSFAKTHGMDVGETIDVDGQDQVLWPVHCVEHTHGAALIKELNKDRIHKYFHKGTDPNIDSYSVFFDNEKKNETGLDAFLREKEVSKVFLAGLTTEYCVKYTALDALELGYEVAVVLDTCRPVNLDPNDEKKAIVEMKKAGVEFINSDVL